eukprot:EG_transcript_45509
MRVSLKLNENEFAPMTFVIDTGAPRPLFLGEPARRLLSDRGILKKDAGNQLVLKVDGRPCVVNKTPRGQLPANIMGLPLLMQLKLSTSLQSFTFDDSFKYLELTGVDGLENLDDEDIQDPL